MNDAGNFRRGGIVRGFLRSAKKWFRKRTRVDIKRDGAQIDAYGRAHLAEELRADGRRDGLHLDGYGAAKYCHFCWFYALGFLFWHPLLVRIWSGISSRSGQIYSRSDDLMPDVGGVRIWSGISSRSGSE